MYTEIILVEVTMRIRKAGDTLPGSEVDNLLWKHEPVIEDIERVESSNPLYQYDEVRLLEDNISFSFSPFGENCRDEFLYGNIFSQLEDDIGQDTVYEEDLLEIEKIGLERLKATNNPKSKWAVFITAWEYMGSFDYWGDYDETWGLIGYVDLQAIGRQLQTKKMPQSWPIGTSG